ncbi:penicillin-binding protein 2 [Robiginitomaculum antarcticum]|uniref:penicillin-binding protein 2 n=1 Tax=Robiginitomaculum antarcticum TaxID=437507 RepID=UPI000367E3FA|nr:penicillin-binding protein 2 [Robiginitomaculum antarcticum]
MSDREKLNKEFSRRALVLGGGGMTLFGIIGARLHNLQVVHGQDYRTLSENNQFNFQIIVPDRGRIIDRNGFALATNRMDYRLMIVPERIENIDLTLRHLSTFLDIGERQSQRIQRDIKRNRGFVPVLIEDHLTWEQFAALNLNLPDLPGVIPQSGQTRQYPPDGEFSHILGYVGKPGPKALEEDDNPLLRQPTFQIGKTGVEAVVDKRLRGERGRLKVEVNALGRIVREFPNESDAARPGEDVYLTIDSKLQTQTAKAFGEESGGAVVMDVQTGELRVLLSMPTFDANLFVSGLTQADMDRMNADEKRPQFNKVIGGGYPPASTFKMVVAMAGLENGLINPNESVFCKGKVQLGPRTFHCWKRRGHGRMDMRNAVKHSCDSYFYTMAERIGIDRIKQMGLRMGLGQTFDIGIEGQSPGLLPDDEWKRNHLNDAWRTGDSFNASIGQGFVLATPLQLAVMAARLANGKYAVTPHLIVGGGVPDFDLLKVNPEHLGHMQSAMYAVCEEPGGTAYRPNSMGFEGVKMAGKTGTGQVKGISAAERAVRVRRNEELPWKFRDHSIFVGYAPFDNPRFAASCIVEHGGSGARKAADMVRGMLRSALASDGYETRANLTEDM